MAAESLSRYLAWWNMLTPKGEPRLSELPHLAPIMKELDALIAEAREREGLIQESAKEELVPVPDRPPGRDATANRCPPTPPAALQAAKCTGSLKPRESACGLIPGLQSPGPSGREEELLGIGYGGNRR